MEKVLICLCLGATAYGVSPWSLTLNTTHLELTFDEGYVRATLQTSDLVHLDYFSQNKDNEATYFSYSTLFLDNALTLRGLATQWSETTTFNLPIKGNYLYGSIEITEPNVHFKGCIEDYTEETDLNAHLTCNHPVHYLLEKQTTTWTFKSIPHDRGPSHRSRDDSDPTILIGTLTVGNDSMLTVQLEETPNEPIVDMYILLSLLWTSTQLQSPVPTQLWPIDSEPFTIADSLWTHGQTCITSENECQTYRTCAHTRPELNDLYCSDGDNLTSTCEPSSDTPPCPVPDNSQPTEANPLGPTTDNSQPTEGADSPSQKVTPVTSTPSIDKTHSSEDDSTLKMILIPIIICCVLMVVYVYWICWQKYYIKPKTKFIEFKKNVNIMLNTRIPRDRMERDPKYIQSMVFLYYLRDKYRINEGQYQPFSRYKYEFDNYLKYLKQNVKDYWNVNKYILNWLEKRMDYFEKISLENSSSQTDKSGVLIELELELSPFDNCIDLYNCSYNKVENLNDLKNQTKKKDSIRLFVPSKECMKNYNRNKGSKRSSGSLESMTSRHSMDSVRSFSKLRQVVVR
jgi:hypothetical protein